MNKTRDESLQFIYAVKDRVASADTVESVICAPFPYLRCLVKRQGASLRIGAQNMHFESEGAYTGEIAPQMLSSIGVSYVVLGHSERREMFNETDEAINKKVHVSFSNGLIPIICVGESLEDREAGQTNQIVEAQTVKALEGLTKEQAKQVVIAYEPVWAIGTGKTATSEDANSSIKEIRKEVEKNYGKEVADEIIIQYGGSVKSSNAKELFTTSDIDGGLVGGASLKPDEFAKIVNFE